MKLIIIKSIPKPKSIKKSKGKPINNSIKNFMTNRRIPISQPQVFDGNDPSTLNIKPSVMNSLASSFVNNETQIYEKAVNELVNHVDVINTGFNKINNSFPR